MAGLRNHRIVVVSGGGSAAPSLGYTPRSPAVPASVTPPRNLRRLNGLACWVFMGTFLPDAGQCDTENTGQWMLLPSHKQAQHLTLAVSRARKPQRGSWIGTRRVAPCTFPHPL